MKLVWPRLRGALLLISCALMLLPNLARSSDDALILAAHEARRKADLVRLDELAARADDALLAPYLRYWQLSARLAQAGALDDIALLASSADFLRQHDGSVVAERLRIDLLAQYFKAERWADFMRHHAGLRHPDLKLRCDAWQAGLALGQADALAALKAAFDSLDRAPASCHDAIARAASAGHITPAALWQRARRQADSRQPELALKTWQLLPAAIAPAPQEARQAVHSAAAWLDRLPANFATRTSQRELVIAALSRIARSDARIAFERLLSLQDRLSHDERAHLHGVIAMHAAIDHFPEALSFYQAARQDSLSPLQRAWQVRAALRAERWPLVAQAIAAMPEAEAARPEWTYWRGRALAAGGDEVGARAAYRRIAERSDFYGLLAAEALGQDFRPPAATALPAASLQAAEQDAAIRRALAFFRLELRTEGLREWVWALRDRDEDFRLAAAHIALRHGLYDRAINSAELANPEAHFNMRFLTPYREFIEPAVHARGLDLSWAYGLMRQESRFTIPARSSAGAQGLMQVMPATGKWVAGKIGLSNYDPRRLAEPDLNVLLGTHYMRIMLDDLDQHPVLASAGYNAGPRRARRWRDDKTLEGAIYVETIPFDETRDYVKKVMANTIVYATLLEGRSQSLLARLGQIAPLPATAD